MGASPGLPVYLKRHSFIIKRFCVENPETNQKFSFRSNTWKLQTNPIWYFCSRWSVYSQTDSGRSSSPPWFPSETGFFFLTGFFFGAFSPWWDHFCCLFHPAAFTFWWHLPLMPPSQIALKPEWLKAAAAAALRLLYQTEKPVCKCSCCWKADGGEKRLFQHPAPQRQAGGGGRPSRHPRPLWLVWFDFLRGGCSTKITPKTNGPKTQNTDGFCVMVAERTRGRRTEEVQRTPLKIHQLIRTTSADHFEFIDAGGLAVKWLNLP